MIDENGVNKIKVGFSIKDPVFKDPDKEQLATHDSLEEFVTSLKSNGVNSIEIRKLSRELNHDTYKAYNNSIQKIWDTGLEITIHGDLTGNYSGEKFVDEYPSMKYILENFQKYQNRLVITLHALQEKRTESTFSSEELKEQTIDMLKDWTQKVELENLPVYFALENNRNKEKSIDPGNSCEVVVEMVESVNSPHLGICWDMGHLYSNLMTESERNLKMGDLPPKEFLEKVIHTHIHGLNTVGRTHFPLTEKYTLPIEEYVNALKSHNYEGVYNLELSFERFEKGIPVVEMVNNSVRRLKNL